MLKLIHLLNAGLWFLNALLWTFYAHVPLIGGFSFFGVALSLYLAKLEGER